ncbi:hypothetical protein [Ktedonospora formicarum]|uniref:Transmembrane protein n=1 Tax=Ktedonospora formicarum TaxID=2778364 RepID=A0A8J3I5Z1_9CHLR|nr:hypothetical protein [Ktedonospora formicarum]GHO48016.1 hypothetical protein KSX_61790 [Ktedonospora formicarum]
MHGQHCLTTPSLQAHVTLWSKLILLMITALVLFLLSLSFAFHFPSVERVHDSIFGAYQLDEGPPDSPMPIYVGDEGPPDSPMPIYVGPVL